MRELFIHIGAHKTGTTSLQSCFEDQTKTLRKLGVLYPKTNWFHHSQHRLAFAMKGMRDPKTKELPDLAIEVAALNAAIAASDCPKIIISSEEFFSCSEDSIQALKAALDVDVVRVVATLRRPDTLFLSMYNQKVKQPGNKFARAIQGFVKEPRSLDRDMNFKACMDPWIDAFGVENTTVLLYEDGSSIVQMLKVLGVPQDALPVPTPLNRSVPGVVIEMMRVAKFAKMDRAEQVKLFQLGLREMSDRPPFYLDDDSRRAIIRDLMPDIQNLFERLGRPNPYRLSHYTPVEEGPVRPNITLADLMQLIETLLQKQRR